MEMKLISISAILYNICIKCLNICNINCKYLKNSSLYGLFLTVFCRGAAVSFLKTTGEVGGVVKANLVSYF